MDKNLSSNTVGGIYYQTTLDGMRHTILNFKRLDEKIIQPDKRQSIL